jgi:CheY-like chemotaxis protein
MRTAALDETEFRHRQQLVELRGAMAMVESGQARSMSISGLDFSDLDAELRDEAAARGLQLDMEMLPGGHWGAKVQPAQARPTEHPKIAVADVNAPNEPVRRPHSVLLVEDDPTLAEYIRRYLANHGLEVQTAASEEDAEESLRTWTPGLVLLDINLPGRSGWSLLRSPIFAQAGSPATVIVSATNIRNARLHEIPVAGYLPKPFAMTTLLEVVSRILDGNDSDESSEGII